MTMENIIKWKSLLWSTGINITAFDIKNIWKGLFNF